MSCNVKFDYNHNDSINHSGSLILCLGAILRIVVQNPLESAVKLAPFGTDHTKYMIANTASLKGRIPEAQGYEARPRWRQPTLVPRNPGLGGR